MNGPVTKRKVLCANGNRKERIMQVTVSFEELQEVLNTIQKSQNALTDIYEALMEPPEDDEHGNSAYSADKKLDKIRNVLASVGYATYIKIPQFVRDRE